MYRAKLYIIIEDNIDQKKNNERDMLMNITTLPLSIDL